MKYQGKLFKKKKKIKSTNYKMAKKMCVYQQLNLKIKLSKQPEQKQNLRYGGHLEGYQLGGGRGRMGEKVQGLRRTNW